jgi:hypothetical protein
VERAPSPAAVARDPRITVIPANNCRAQRRIIVIHQITVIPSGESSFARERRFAVEGPRVRRYQPRHIKAFTQDASHPDANPAKAQPRRGERKQPRTKSGRQSGRSLGVSKKKHSGPAGKQNSPAKEKPHPRYSAPTSHPTPCHPERSRGTLRSPMPATPHQGVHTRRKSPRRQPRQSPAPKGRKKTAQDKVQDASPDKVLGKQEKRFRPRRDQHSNQNHTHSPNVTKVSLAPSKPASHDQRCHRSRKRDPPWQ